MTGSWAAMADDSDVITLYTPQSGDEIVYGWVSNSAFLVSSWNAACGYHALRTYDIVSGTENLLFDHCFDSAALDETKQENYGRSGRIYRTILPLRGSYINGCLFCRYYQTGFSSGQGGKCLPGRVAAAGQSFQSRVVRRGKRCWLQQTEVYLHPLIRWKTCCLFLIRIILFRCGAVPVRPGSLPSGWKKRTVLCARFPVFH